MPAVRPGRTMAAWVWFKNRHRPHNSGRSRQATGTASTTTTVPSTSSRVDAPLVGKGGKARDRRESLESTTTTTASSAPEVSSSSAAAAKCDGTGGGSGATGSSSRCGLGRPGRGLLGKKSPDSGPGADSLNEACPGGVRRNTHPAGPGGPTTRGPATRGPARNVHRSLHRLSMSPPVPVKEKLTQPELRITFNDQMTSTYEYPSEQSLLEELPPEPGDFDYIHQLHGKKGISDDDNDVVDLNPNAGAALRSTPGLGSGAPDVNDADKKGGLGSYRSRYMGDYKLGEDIFTEQKSGDTATKNNQAPKEEVIDEVQIKPAEDDDNYNWSNAASADLLF